MYARSAFLLASLILAIVNRVTAHPLVNLRSLHHAKKGTSQHERRARLIKRHQPIRSVWEYPENEEGYNFGDNIRTDALSALDHLIPKGDGDRAYWTCHVYLATLTDPDMETPARSYSQALVEEFDRLFNGKYRNPIRTVDGSASVIVVAQITHPVDDRFFAYVQMVPEKPGVKLTMFEQAFPGVYGDKPSDGLGVSWRHEELFWDPDRAIEELPILEYLGRVNKLVQEENMAFFDATHGNTMQGVLNAANNVTAAFPKFDTAMNRPQNFRDNLGKALVEEEIPTTEALSEDQPSL
ncbi:MAG: hypothetical protein M1822_004026 [Bathelium mastoideum]|nr:MAG: hypothetical protein M1822_004026 [Bathelium mastoideum]